MLNCSLRVFETNGVSLSDGTTDVDVAAPKKILKYERCCMYAIEGSQKISVAILTALCEQVPL